MSALSGIRALYGADGAAFHGPNPTPRPRAAGKSQVRICRGYLLMGMRFEYDDVVRKVNEASEDKELERVPERVPRTAYHQRVRLVIYNVVQKNGCIVM